MGFGAWHEGTGTRYEVRVGDVLWLDQGQYHGRAPVEIRDRVSGEVLKRTGDVKLIGNFSPIWVNVHGRRILVDHILRFNRSLQEELEDLDQHDRFLKHGIIDPGPHDWLPKPKRKGKRMGDSEHTNWGSGPFDSPAGDLFLSGMQEALVMEIGKRIEPDTSASNHEIIAGAGLLNYLTTLMPGPTGEGAPLDLTEAALEAGLFALAVASLDRVLSDGAWFQELAWPDRKLAAVQALRDALEAKASSV